MSVEKIFRRREPKKENGYIERLQRYNRICLDEVRENNDVT